MKKVFFVVGLFFTMSVMMGHAQLTVGSLLEPADGALLDLKEHDMTSTDNSTATRGLIFPRMYLTNVDELYPMYAANDPEYIANKAALKAQHIGLTVYNLNAVDFNPGLHVWNGKNWVKPVTELPAVTKTSVNILDLRAVTFDGIGYVPIVSGSAAGGAGGTLLTFGKDEFITIPENGAYVFSLRLYGTHGFGAASYYLSLWANNTTDPNNLKDIAEIDLSINRLNSGTAAASYSIEMGAYFKAGDIVRFKLSYNSSSQQSVNPVNGVTTWRLHANPAPDKADRTSLIWWKL